MNPIKVLKDSLPALRDVLEEILSSLDMQKEIQKETLAELKKINDKLDKISNSDNN